MPKPKSLESIFTLKPQPRKKSRRGLTASTKKTLILASGGKCMYCHKKFDPLNLDVHHIKALSKGGSNQPTNLTVLCAGCHRRLHKGLIRSKDLKPIKKTRARARKRVTAKKKTRRKRSTSMKQYTKKMEKLFTAG